MPRVRISCENVNFLKQHKQNKSDSWYKQKLYIIQETQMVIQGLKDFIEINYARLSCSTEILLTLCFVTVFIVANCGAKRARFIPSPTALL